MMEGLTFSCPVCGADVPRQARACPECGACERSGWSEDRYLDGVNLPDEDPFHGRLLGGRDGESRIFSKDRLWLVVAVILLLSMFWMTFRGAW